MPIVIEPRGERADRDYTDLKMEAVEKLCWLNVCCKTVMKAGFDIAPDSSLEESPFFIIDNDSKYCVEVYRHVKELIESLPACWEALDCVDEDYYLQYVSIDAPDEAVYSVDFAYEWYFDRMAALRRFIAWCDDPNCLFDIFGKIRGLFDFFNVMLQAFVDDKRSEFMPEMFFDRDNNIVLVKAWCND